MQLRWIYPSAKVMVMLVAGITMPGCRSQSAKTHWRSGTVVARVGEATLTTDDLLRRLGPVGRIRDFETAKKQALDELVRSELLAQEGMRHGWDQDPAVLDAQRKALEQVTRQKLLQSDSKPPTDQEMSAYLAAHEADFQKPKRMRVQQLFLAAPDRKEADAQKVRSAARARIEQFLGELQQNEERRAHPAETPHYNPRLLSEFVRRYSEDRLTKAKDGDTGFMTKEEMATRYSQQFADAIFALDEPRHFSSVIETPAGFHVAWISYIEPARNPDLNDPAVQNEVRERLTREHRKEAEARLMDRLRSEAKVEIDQQVFAAMENPNKVTPVAAELGSPQQKKE